MKVCGIIGTTDKGMRQYIGGIMPYEKARAKLAKMRKDGGVIISGKKKTAYVRAGIFALSNHEFVKTAKFKG